MLKPDRPENGCLMPRTHLLLLGVSACLALSACAGPPACPVDGVWLAEPVANAGCMVRRDDRLLVVRDRLSGKLGFPAGASMPPEQAHCTALRETWEETGYPVRVEELLETFPGGFRLYHCTVPADVPAQRDVPRPPQALLEIEAIHWLLPDEIQAGAWRFPSQWPRARELFRTLPAGD